MWKTASASPPSAERTTPASVADHTATFENRGPPRVYHQAPWTELQLAVGETPAETPARPRPAGCSLGPPPQKEELYN